MKYKKIVILCMALILVGFCGCGQLEKNNFKDKEKTQQKENLQFSIKTETYEEGDIHIEYPHVENLVNQEITDWYNNQFKSAVNIHTEEAEEGDLAAASDTVNENFQVTYQSDEMISILIEGSFYAEGAAHPYSYKRSYNINLKTGETMSITDEYTPDDIVNDLLSGKNYTMIANAETLSPLEGEILEYAKQEIEIRDKDFMLESLEKCDYDFTVDSGGKVVDNREMVYGYSLRLKDGKWAICTDVCHALGDYLIIRYDR